MPVMAAALPLTTTLQAIPESASTPSASRATGFSPQGAAKFGSFICPEHHGAVVHRVVQREDVRVVINPDGQPADGYLPQEVPALPGFKVFHRCRGSGSGGLVRHGPEPTPGTGTRASTLHRVRPPPKGEELSE